MISASLFFSTCVSLDLWGSGMIWICSTQNTCDKLDGKQKCTNTFELNLWDQMQMWWCECKTVEARVQMRLRCAPVCQHVRRDRLLFDFRPSRPERVELLHTCLRKKECLRKCKIILPQPGRCTFLFENLLVKWIEKNQSLNWAIWPVLQSSVQKFCIVSFKYASNILRTCFDLGPQIRSWWVV